MHNIVENSIRDILKEFFYNSTIFTSSSTHLYKYSNMVGKAVYDYCTV